MFEVGEIILIENDEYIILSMLKDNNNVYIYLESVLSPKKIIVGKLSEFDSFETLNDVEEIKYALAKFNNNNN